MHLDVAKKQWCAIGTDESVIICIKSNRRSKSLGEVRGKTHDDHLHDGRNRRNNLLEKLTFLSQKNEPNEPSHALLGIHGIIGEKTQQP